MLLCQLYTKNEEKKFKTTKKNKEKRDHLIVYVCVLCIFTIVGSSKCF